MSGVRKGLAYWIKSRLYVSVTNSCNAATFVSLRGPGFPFAKELIPLDGEPDAKEIFELVDDAYERDERKKISGMGEDDTGVTFAGIGEPLLRLDVVAESAKLILEKRHGIPLRVKTNGLVPGGDNHSALSQLADAGIGQVSVFLPGADPMSFEKVLAPQDGYSFGHLCDFISTAAQVGLSVECTTIARPNTDVSAVRQLAHALGAVETRVYEYFP